MAGPADTELLKRRAATASRLLTPDAYISRCSFGNDESGSRLVCGRSRGGDARSRKRARAKILEKDAVLKECFDSKD